MKKIYLGDSVYAQRDDYRIILTIENDCPNDPSNTIFLEPEIIVSLIQFAKREGIINEQVCYKTLKEKSTQKDYCRGSVTPSTER